ncbi:MAG: T9SS type A sorting domain-containing protein [Bacteroidales bacterium]|nr:T9SS type A sorting domain-containing protein [Bacteroidales bacterium]
MTKKITVLLIGMLVFFMTIQAQSWTQIGQDINGEAADDYFGRDVDISADGSTFITGAMQNDEIAADAGKVRVYENIDGTWTQKGADLFGENEDDRYGYQVSMNDDGSVIAVGTPYNDGFADQAGYVQIFEYVGETWTQTGGNIYGDTEYDYSGRSVSLNGNGTRIAIGADGYDHTGNSNGQIRVFDYIDGTWTQIGSDIYGEYEYDNFARSVALSADGSTLVAGSWFNDENGEDAGKATVFKYTEGDWVQRGDDILGEAAGDFCGRSVSISDDGSIIAIGAIFNDGNGEDSGHARIFEDVDGTWVQIGDDIDGETAFDYSGISVSLNNDGTILAVGSHFNSENGEQAGHARIFKNVSSVWTQIGDDIDGEAANDNSGGSVSLSSDGIIIAVGAVLSDAGGIDSGQVRVFQSPASDVNSIQNTGISVYPNPTNGIINFEFVNNNIQKLTISDITGKQIIEKTTIEQKEIIDLSSFVSGIYIISIQTDNEIFNTKIVKR